jgi:hypothetical protein
VLITANTLTPNFLTGEWWETHLLTHFLVTDDKPDGPTLEGILAMVRGDWIKRAAHIVDDDRYKTRKVRANNVQIMPMLAECIALAEENNAMLTKAFGPSRKGEPSIGVA